MLNIIIAGAGTIGCYIAHLLSKGGHNIILIDTNEAVLKAAASYMDVGIKKGNATDWELLDDLSEFSPHFFLSLTNEDHTNLVACTIAKNLGLGSTVARVSSDAFLNRSRLDFGRIFYVDHFVCPELLVASEIVEMISSQGALLTEMFAHGAITLKSFQVPPLWKYSDVPLKDLKFPSHALIALIERTTKLEGTKEHRVIFPHGSDCIQPEDKVVVIGETDTIDKIHHFFGIQEHLPKDIVIIGGSLIGIHLARMMEQRGARVRILEKSRERCSFLSVTLKETTIIHVANHLQESLKSEKVFLADLVVAASEDDENNLAAALQAQELRVKKTITILSSPEYISLAEHLNLHLIVSPRQATANLLISWMIKDRVSSIVSLFDGEAEVLEIEISAHSKIVGIALNELGPLLPKDFLIAVIQNRGRINIAHGNRILSPGDSVIVVAHPRHTNEFYKVF